MYSITSSDGENFAVVSMDGRSGSFVARKGGGFSWGRGMNAAHIDVAARQCLEPLETKVTEANLWYLIGRGGNNIRYKRKDGTPGEALIRNLTFSDDDMVHYEKVGEANPHRSLHIKQIIGVQTPEGWCVL